MQNCSFSQQIESESWESLASMLISMRIDLGKEDAKRRRLRKEMEATKHVLYEQLLSFNGNQEIGASFFVGTVKTLAGIEKRLDASGVKNNEFMTFMKLILGKIRKQKLLVKKPMEMQNEFKKMKGVIEDAGSL